MKLHGNARTYLHSRRLIVERDRLVQAGGDPVMVDVGERDYNLDPAAVVDAVTPRTRCLLPVHLYGQLADMAALQQLAKRHDLTIVEDACQAHGARRAGRRAGATGLAGAFSFYPSKNLGAFGDAGAVVTNNRELAARMRAPREHGQRRRYVHDAVGYTARLDTIQAVALLRKLPLLDAWNEQRQAAARFYEQHLAGVGDLLLPPALPESEPVRHLYVVRTGDPDGLGGFLGRRAIATGRHYPQPLHRARASDGSATGREPSRSARERDALDAVRAAGDDGAVGDEVVVVCPHLLHVETCRSRAFR
jgi:dTDP-4-amino-4,6-dideoxygalactose transaminase